MGACGYCGEPAGLFRSIHPECEAKQSQAKRDLSLAFTNMMLVPRPPSAPTFKAIIERLGADARLDASSLRSEILTGLGTSLDAALEDHDLSQEEIDRFEGVLSAFDLGPSAIEEAGIKTRLVKALILKDLSEGELPDRVRVSQVSIALKRGERILWIFNGVRRQEPRTSSYYEGGSHGFSFRVMKGVSYRVGSSRGRRVQTTEIANAGAGDLIISSDAIYFASPTNTKKIGLGSIVSVENYEDGIVVTPSRGKYQIFMLEDATFAANLILKAGAL